MLGFIYNAAAINSRGSNQPNMKWTIAPPLIKIQDKQRLFSVHLIWDRKHVYLFLLGFFTVMSFWLDSQTCQSIFWSG